MEANKENFLEGENPALIKYNSCCVSLWHAVLKKINNIYLSPLIFVRHQSIFRVTQNFFNQYNIYLYTIGTTFCQHVFLFCPNIFSRNESIFWVSRHFFLPQNIFFVTHIVLVRNIISRWNIFLLTQYSFLRKK